MSKLQEYAEMAGFGTMSYSGRAMYGRQCLGIQINGNVGRFFADVLYAVVENCSEQELQETVQELAECFHDGMRTDQLGKGSVIYFPKIKHV